MCYLDLLVKVNILTSDNKLSLIIYVLINHGGNAAPSNAEWTDALWMKAIVEASEINAWDALINVQCHLNFIGFP